MLNHFYLTISIEFRSLLERRLLYSGAGIYEEKLSWVLIKGQIISEAIFLVLNSSKKQTKCLQNFALATKEKVFRSFFGSIENKKKVFWD